MDKANFIPRIAWITAGVFWLGMVLYLVHELLATGYRPGDAVTSKFTRIAVMVFAIYPVFSGLVGGLIGLSAGHLIRVFWNKKPN